MRLFTGIALPTELQASLGEVLAEIGQLPGVRPMPVENLHITTKFIGEWGEERVDEIMDRLRFAHQPIAISVGGLGNFTGIVFAGVEKTPDLVSLAGATETALEPLGISRERRPYSPHVTLARTPASIHSFTAGNVFGSFQAREFHLYRSIQSAYTRLATFPLQ